MKTYVLDSSAVLRYLSKDAGFERISEVLKLSLEGSCIAIMSAIQWSEVAGKMLKRFDEDALLDVSRSLSAFGVSIRQVSENSAVEAARIRTRTGLAFADSLAAELAWSHDCALLTADFEFKLVENLIQVEFLPARQ